VPELKTTQRPETSGPVPEARSGERAARMRTLAILVGMVALPIVVLDQWSKYYVSAHMTLYQSIPVIPHWFDITYTQNPGAAFSMFATLPAYFRIAFLFTLTSAAIVVLLYLIYHNERVTLSAFAFALIMAGALGNLIDRAVRAGLVIDFIRVHYYELNYPVFNVADMAITVGVALVFISTLLARHGENR